jgi:hypothetical protein
MKENASTQGSRGGTGRLWHDYGDSEWEDDWGTALALLDEMERQRLEGRRQSPIAWELDDLIRQCRDGSYRFWRWTDDSERSEFPWRAKANLPLGQTFADSALERLGANFVMRFLDNDFGFFEEVARVLSVRSGRHEKAGEGRGEPIQLRLIKAAYDWAAREGRNPTTKELKDEAERQGIKVSPSGWNKTLDHCKLGFLKTRRSKRLNT